MVVVLPFVVVDELTLPPPAVTEEETPPPEVDAAVSSLSMIVQVLPSSSVTFSDAVADAAMEATRMSGNARGCFSSMRAFVRACVIVISS